jgi:hypothetical protein
MMEAIAAVTSKTGILLVGWTRVVGKENQGRRAAMVATGLELVNNRERCILSSRKLI